MCSQNTPVVSAAAICDTVGGSLPPRYPPGYTPPPGYPPEYPPGYLMLTVTCVYRYVWLNEYSGQFLPIIALIALRVVVGVGDFLIKKFGKKKKDRMTEMADEYGKSRATEFNVGTGGSRKDTGVRYADVAGIDTVKADIEETMRMILGAPEFDAIGARPPRVQSAACDP